MPILNPFIQQDIVSHNISSPTIDVLLTEQFGQKGEDLIVESLLRAAAKQDSINLSNTRFIEIGGNHPIATSATYLLEKKFQLRGDIYEANSSLIEELVRVRPLSRIFNEAVCPPSLIVDGRAKIHISAHSELSSLSEKFVENWKGFETSIIDVKDVAGITMDQAFDRCSTPICLLAIDIEGLDLDIIKASKIAKIRPHLVQIEPSNHFKKNNDLQMLNFFNEINYELIAMTDVNLIFRDSSPQPRRKPLDFVAGLFERLVRRRV